MGKRKKIVESYQTRLSRYETEKKELKEKNALPDEYHRALVLLSKKYGV